MTSVGSRHALDVRKDDLYETPAVAVHALMKAENLPKHIWEPACGRGAIVNVLREAGHVVVASDLVDYGVPITIFWRYDFLMEHKAPEGTEAIVTNPPFKLADEFAAHALTLVPRVFMLLRLAFLEGTARTPILENHLARVHVFRNRLPMMHRDGWTGPKATSATAFAWFCWNKSHTGPTELHRVSW